MQYLIRQMLIAGALTASLGAGCSPTGQMDWGFDWQKKDDQSFEARKRRAELRAAATTVEKEPKKKTTRVEHTGGFKLDWFKPRENLFGNKGHQWTILCLELPGRNRQSEAESVADTLRRTKNIRPKEVLVKNDPDASRVYYGSYWREEVDAAGRLNVPPKMTQDMAMIKTLSGPAGERFFYEARVVPYPTPNVGHPEWELSNNPGVFTLRIAIFYNEGKMKERKKYAADYCAELRKRGHEAYYRHGEITSEVYVGSFGEDAQIKGRRSGVAVFLPSPEVQALQRKENFMYELWNMKVFSASSSESRSRSRRASRLLRVTEALGEIDPLGDS